LVFSKAGNHVSVPVDIYQYGSGPVHVFPVYKAVMVRRPGRGLWRGERFFVKGVGGEGRALVRDAPREMVRILNDFMFGWGMRRCVCSGLLVRFEFDWRLSKTNVGIGGHFLPLISRLLFLVPRLKLPFIGGHL